MSTSTTHPTRLDIQPLLDDFVQAMRRLYGRRLSRIILFGSFARGEAHAESDVDLLVLLHDEKIDLFAELDEMLDAKHTLLLRHERLLNAFPATETGYAQRTELLYYNVAEEGITIFEMTDHILPLIERSDKTLRDARHLFTELESYESAVSRAYYAMFYVGEALLLSEGVVVKSHGGLSNQLAQVLVKPGKLPAKASKYLSGVFEKRQTGDYGFNPNFSRETAETVLAQATEFCAMGKAYLREQGFVPDEPA